MGKWPCPVTYLMLFVLAQAYTNFQYIRDYLQYKSHLARKIKSQGYSYLRIIAHSLYRYKYSVSNNGL